MTAITSRAGGVRVRVHLQPRASRSEFAGMFGDALKVRVAAPPVDGAANEALVDLLVAALAVPRRAVKLVGGASSRSKLVEIDGVTVADVEQLLR